MIGSKVAVAMTMLLVAWPATPSRAELALAIPETVSVFRNGPPETPSGCGVRADYAFGSFTLRIELISLRNPNGVEFKLRAFSPTTVGMYLKDIWLRTESYASETLLKRARVNSIGILEAQATVARPESEGLLREIVAEGATIEVFTDTTLPAARVPLSLPGPLAEPVAVDLRTCLEAAKIVPAS